MDNIRHICQYIVSWQFCKFHHIVFYSQFIPCSWIMSRSRRIPSIGLSYGIDLHTKFPTQQWSPRKKRDTPETYRSGRKITDWHGFVIHFRCCFMSGEWTRLGFSNYMFSCDTYIVLPLPFSMYIIHIKEFVYWSLNHYLTKTMVFPAQNYREQIVSRPCHLLGLEFTYLQRRSLYWTGAIFGMKRCVCQKLAGRICKTICPHSRIHIMYYAVTEGVGCRFSYLY